MMSFVQTPLEVVDWERIVTNLHESLDTDQKRFLLACLDGDVATVKELLEKDDHLVNCTEPIFGLTPLHVAAINNHLGVIKELILYSRNTDVSLDTMGRTPLDLSWHNFRIDRRGSTDRCLEELIEHIETKAQDIVRAEDRRQQAPEAGWTSKDLEEVMKFMFPVVTEEIMSKGADFLCFFEYGDRNPVTLYLDAVKVYQSCDRPEKDFRIKNGTEKEVLKIDCKNFKRATTSAEQSGENPNAETEPGLICIILMKASAEWLEQTKSDDRDSAALESFLRTLLCADKNKEAENFRKGKLIADAAKDEVNRTLLKVDLCMKSIRELTDEERNFTNHKAAVAFLRFLETFALQDCFQDGFTEGQRKFLASRKRQFFETFWPDEGIKVIRKIRQALFDRSHKQMLLFSCEQAFQTFLTNFADNKLFFERLLEFASEASRVFWGKHKGENSSCKTNVFGFFQATNAKSPQKTNQQGFDDFERKFLENAKVYILNFDDPNTDTKADLHYKRYELEFDLIVNVRSLPSLCSGEIKQRRNCTTHSRAEYTLMTEDIASCLSDYYRRSISKNVFEKLKKLTSIRRIEEELQKIVRETNQKFKNVEIWYRCSETMSFSSATRKASSETDTDVTLPDSDVIDLYLRSLAPCLVEPRQHVRDAYINMKGTEKAALLEHLKNSRIHSASELMKKRLGFQDKDVNTIIDSLEERTGKESVHEKTLTSMRILWNVRELTKAYKTSWVNIANLYSTYVLEKHSFTFLQSISPFKEWGPDLRQDVQRRIEKLPDPTEKTLGNATLSDVVKDLLTLRTGTYFREKLLLDDFKALFSDIRVVEYIASECVIEKGHKESDTKNENFFCNPPLDGNEGSSTTHDINLNGTHILQVACSADYMAPLAARLVSLLSGSKPLPDTFRSLAKTILSTDMYCQFIDDWSTCEHACEIFKQLLHVLRTGQYSQEAIYAVLKGAISVSSHPSLPQLTVPGEVCQQASTMIYDLIQQRRLVDAETLEKIVDWPESSNRDHDFCRCWLQISKAEVLKKTVQGSTEADRANTLLIETLGQLPVTTQEDTLIHRMMGKNMEQFIFGLLTSTPSITAQQQENSNLCETIQELTETLLNELWMHVRDDGSQTEAPPFVEFVNVCLKSDRYKQLLSTNHYCRRFFNIYMLKMNVAYNMGRMAWLRPTKQDKHNTFLRAARLYHELLQEECQTSRSSMKFGALRSPMRLGHVYRQLALTAWGRGHQHYYRAKAFELFLLLRAKQVNMQGPDSPHVRQTMKQLKKLFSI